MGKKKEILILFMFLFLMPLCLAEVEITSETSSIIQNIETPTTLNLQIKNLGADDNFEIYTLISGIEILPRSPFSIKARETLNLPVQIKISEKIKKNLGLYTFAYKIKGQLAGIQDEKMTVKISTLEQSLNIIPENIKIDSEKAIINIENKENFNFQNLNVQFKSVFFDEKRTLNIPAEQTTIIEIPLNQEELRKIIAGTYILTTTIETDTKAEESESIIKLLEKSGLSVYEESSGIIINKKKIEKTNEGNVQTIAEIEIKRNILSRLVTTFSVQPSQVERKGFFVFYIFQQELKPTEKFTVTATTNYTFPVITLALIIIIAILVYYYTSQDILLKKRVTFVRTKKAEFALKVTVNVKARKFIEKVRVVDKLPPLVSLYKRFGVEEPSKIDEKNKRLIWDIQELSQGDERIFSYIIYSKIGVVGKFALPVTTALYEKQGKIKQATSNKVFFVSERKELKEE